MPVATKIPTALTGTSANTTYLIQSKGGAPVNILGASSDPDPSDEAFTIGSGHPQYIYVTPGAGESIYIWVDANATKTGIVVFAEN